jgi:hypothetical protein
LFTVGAKQDLSLSLSLCFLSAINTDYVPPAAGNLELVLKVLVAASAAAAAAVALIPSLPPPPPSLATRPLGLVFNTTNFQKKKRGTCGREAKIRMDDVMTDIAASFLSSWRDHVDNVGKGMASK